jgi:hypothetical protein
MPGTNPQRANDVLTVRKHRKSIIYFELDLARPAAIWSDPSQWGGEKFNAR